MLVGCALANRTQGGQFRPVLFALMRRYATPSSLASARGSDLARLLRPLGLWRRRTCLLRRLSRDWLEGQPPERCHGVGRYAMDSWRIFVDGVLPPAVDDGKLAAYVIWRKRT